MNQTPFTQPPVAPPDAFDDQSPWGTYALKPAEAAWLRVCHAIPNRPGGRRLTLWARRPLKRRFTGPVDAEIWGWRLRLMARGNLAESRWLLMPQQLDAAERQYWARTLPDDGVFIDIGANAGAYSFWAAATCLGPQGRVIAVEPDPDLLRRLRFNAQLNALDRLEIAPLALSDREAEGQLEIGGHNRGENQLTPQPDPAATAPGATAVRVTTLLQLCAEQSIQRIDGLKIDIEGHEHAVLRAFFDHAPAELRPARLQFESCTDAQADALTPLVESHGYRLACAGRMNRIYTRADVSDRP